MDIAPLGFSVDTDPLDKGGKAAEELGKSLNKVADAADKVGAKVDRLGNAARTGTTAMREHGDAAKAAASGLDDVAAKSDGSAAASKRATDGIKDHSSALQEHARVFSTHKIIIDTGIAAQASLANAHANTTSKLKDGTRALQEHSAAANATVAALKDVESAHRAIGASIPKDIHAEAFNAALGQRAANNIQPNKFDLERMAKEQKALDQQRMSIVKLETALDPAAAKIAKLEMHIESLGKAFDSGAIPSQKEYNKLLAEADHQIEKIEKGRNVSTGPIKMFLRTASYALPGVGRVERTLASEEGRGAGIGELATIGLMGGAGVVAAMALSRLTSELMKIPGELTAAADASEMFKRRLTAFGEPDAVNGLENIEMLADRIGMKFGANSELLEQFSRSFERLKATNDQKQNLYEAIVDTGSLGGNTQQQNQSAVPKMASIIDKPVVSAHDLKEMESALPGSLKIVADGLHTTKGSLESLAGAGKLAGQQLADGFTASLKALREELDRVPPSADTASNRLSNSYTRLAEVVAQKTGLNTAVVNAKDALAKRINATVDAWSDGTPTGTQNPDGSPKGGDDLKIIDGATGKTLKPGQLTPKQQKASDILNGANLLAEKYEGTQLSRDAALADVKEIGDKMEQYLVAGGSKANDQFKMMAKALQEAKRQAEEMRTPFQTLTDDVEGFAKALSAGGGGMVSMYREAEKIIERMKHEGGVTQVSMQQVIDKIKERNRLEAEQTMANNSAKSDIQTKLASDILDDRAGVDKLKLEANAEAATFAFEKFGNAVDANDEMVKRYADNLYQLKLRLRDVTDASQAVTLKEQVEDEQRIRTAQAGGASQGDLELLRIQIKRERVIEEKTSQATAATAARTYTVHSGGASNDNPYYGNVGGSTSLQQLTAAVRWAESRNRDYGADGKPIRSRQGALYAMQVMPATAGHPGFGLPAADIHNAAAMDHLGEQLLAKHFDRYGDPIKAALAYHSGRGGLRHPGPRGLQYMDIIRKRLGLGAGAGGDDSSTSTFTVAAHGASAARISSEGLAVANGGAAVSIMGLRTQQEATIKAMNEKSAGTRSLVDASASGDASAVRAAELQLKVLEEQRKVLPEEKEAAKAAVLTADAADRELASARAIGALQSDRNALQQQYSLLRYSGDELRVQEAVLKKRIELQKQGADLTLASSKQELSLAATLEKETIHYEKVADNVRGLQTAWHDVLKGTSNDLLKAFNTAFTGGQHAGAQMLQALKQEALNFLDAILQKMVLSPLMKALQMLGDSVIGSLGGSSGKLGASTHPIVGGVDPLAPLPTGHAYGGAFSGGITAFAAGGVTSGPTLFPMAGGRTGLMGEAGPEAVMPLQRGPDGRLGVVSTGGGGGGGNNIQIIDQRGAKDSAPIKVEERSTGNGMRDLRIMVRDAVKDGMRRTEFDSDMQSNYGVGRTVARR